MIKITSGGFYEISDESAKYKKYVRKDSIQLAYVIEVTLAKKADVVYKLVIMSGGIKYDIATYKSIEKAERDLKTIVGE